MPRYYSEDYLPNPPLTTITEEDTPPPSPIAELSDRVSFVLSDYSDDALPNPPRTLITKIDTPPSNPISEKDRPSVVLPDYSDEDSPNPTLPLITKEDCPSIVYSDYSDEDSPNPPLPLITTNHTPPSKSNDKTLEYNITHSDPYMPLSVSYLCDEVLVRILDKDVTSRVKSLTDLNSLQFFQCDDPY
ncbi:hypothetical protein DFH28DRAFT_887539 [Melampsora americana]|nr:hypothetical protein DFH28DRAFT_887539 [Melampsora americana]